MTQRMSGSGHSITHVSDTARWTALHRATESARPDALFSDPLAERLAGEHAWRMVEFAFPGLKKMMNKKMAGMLQNAPFKFAPENGLAYFEHRGWRTVEVESLFEAAHRLHRLPMLMRLLAWLLPQSDPRHPGRRPWAAVALLTH